MEEEIRIELGGDQAIKESDKINSNLEKLESTATNAQHAIQGVADTTAKSLESSSRKLLTVTQLSESAARRLVRSSESKALFAGANPLETIQIKARLDADRLAGHEKLLVRSRISYEQLADAQKKADNTALLERAISASRKAEVQTNQFTSALTRLNREQDKSRQQDYDKSLQAAIRSSQQGAKEADNFTAALSRLNSEQKREIEQLERLARFAGTTPRQRLVLERDETAARFSNNPAKQNRIISSFDQRINTIDVKERQQEFERLRDAAIAGSQRGARDADQFTTALNKLNLAQQTELANLAKLARFAGVSPRQRLLLEQEDALNRFRNNPQKQELVRSSFQQRINAFDAQETKQGTDSLRQRAIIASQRSIKQSVFTSSDVSLSNDFAAALNKVNNEKERTIVNNKRIIETELAAVRRRVVTEPERRVIDRDSAISRITAAGGTKAQIAALTHDFQRLEDQAEAASHGIGARIAEFITSPTYAARKSLGEFLQEWGRFGLIVGGALIATGVIAKKTFDLIVNAGAEAEQISNLAARLGTTAEQAFRLDAAFKASGISSDLLEGFTRKLSQSIIEGGEAGKKGAEALDTMGVSVFELGGKLKDPYKLILEISDAIRKFPPFKQQALFTDLGGRGALGSLPAFLELRETIAKLGPAIDDNLNKRLKEADDSLDVLKNHFHVFGGEVAGSMLKLQDYFNLIATVAAVPFRAAPAAPLGKFTVGDAESIAAHRDLESGNALIENYKKRAATVEDLQYKISNTTKELAAAEAIATSKGQGFAATERAQQAALGLRNTLAAQKQTLKDLEALPAKLLQSQEFLLAGGSKLVESYERLHVALHLGDQPLLAKYYQETTHALSDFNKELLKQGNAAGPGTANLRNLRRGLQEAQQAAKIGLVADFNKGLSDLQPEALGLTERINEEQRTKQIGLTKEIRAIQDQSVLSSINYQETLAQQQRDKEIRAIEITDAKTIQQKLDFEIRKGVIETEFIQRRSNAQSQALNFELATKIREEQELVAIGERTQSQANARIQALAAQTADKNKQIQLSAIAETAKAQEEALIKSAQIIRDANTAVFDRFKRESEGIFDAMLTRSQNVFQAIGNAFKNAILTAVKDIVSTQVARSLTQLVTGDKVGLTPGAVGTGPLAKIAATLGIGAKPTFGSVQSKLEQAGRIGDWQLIASPLGAAMPVVVANPGDLRQQRVDVTNTSSQVNQSFTIGQSARVPIAATLALATGLGLSSAATASPAGYKPLVEQVTSQLGGSAGEGLSGLGGADYNALRGLAVEQGGFTGQSNLADIASGSKNSLIDILGSGQRPAYASGIPGGIPGTLGIPGIDSSVTAAQSQFPSLPKFTGGFANLGNKLKFLFTGKGAGGIGSLAANGDTVAGTGGVLGRLGSLFGIGGGLGTAGLAATLAPLTLGLGIAGVGGAYKLGQSGGLAGKIAAPFLGAAGGLLTFGSLVALFPALLATGPIGWIVAGALGAAVGLYGVFHKSKEKKLHDLIKSIYGVDITDKKYLNAMVQIAEQKYGGNLDAAVRSSDLREMIELWAQATGQNSKGIVDRAQASVFANTSKGLQQQPTFFNGQVVFPGSTSSTIGIPTLTPQGGYVNSPVVGGANVGSTHTTISLDATATEALLSGQAASYVHGNPREVSRSASSGMDASAARRAIASSVLRPAFLTS